MNNLLEEFTRKAQLLISEPGILEKRPSWPSIKSAAAGITPFGESAVAELKPEHALIFILAHTTPGTRRDTLLKALLKNSLTSIGANVSFSSFACL